MRILTPELTAMLVSTTGVGFLMAWAGIEKSMLEWRRQKRFCPGCGRAIAGRTCGCS